MKKFFARVIDRLTIKQRQYLLAALLGLIAMVVIILIVLKISNNPAIAKSGRAGGEKLAKEEPKRIETAASRSDEQGIWRYQMQQDKEKLEQQIEEIKQALEVEKNPEPNQEIEELKQEINTLRGLVFNHADVTPGEQKAIGNIESEHETPNIAKITFALDDSKENAIKNIEDTIPAGAFARAVLLGGVDAATTLNSPSDPRPVLIRLIDTGTLPRRFKSDLQDCHIIASSYGDLSSERVYARLEKLTCVERQTGEIVETQVAGYVAGEDGKVGLRGKVVEKGQEYLVNSTVGGILQGVAGVMTPQQPMLVSPFGSGVVGTESHKDRFERGLGTGAASSMDRLSKYYIDKAEKLQPVIQIAAGREVDVVFTEGTTIGTELVRKKLEEKRINRHKEETEEALK